MVIITVLVWFYLAYRFYGSFIERRLVKPDDSRETAAHALQDGVDFMPAKTVFLWGHHFSSIAGAGPIIGPILAVSFFGWGPTTLWITLGCVFLGGVHDYLSLMLSVRNKGQGIAEIAGMAISRRTRFVFAVLLWLTLVFIITVFATSAAEALIAKPELVIPTFGVCFLAIGLGLAVYRLKVNAVMASIVAVILAYALVWWGFNCPVSFPEWLGSRRAHVIWCITILSTYCATASLLPVWLLLQPRDFISAVQLFVGIALGIIGIIIVRPVFSAPLSQGGFLVEGKPIWPILFITVACGAISGFHTMVATGTTSKQLDRESQGKIIGYGGMIMEGVLAFLVVMVVSTGLKWGKAPAGIAPDQAAMYFHSALSQSWIICFGSGFGNIVGAIGIPGLGPAIAGLLGAVMVKIFVMTSLDTSTRLGRFIFAETLAKNIPFLRNRVVSTLILLIPAYLLAVTNTYSNIWKMFGASNQLIAAVALIAISAYLSGIKRPTVFTLIPSIFMSLTTIAALVWSTFNPINGYFTSSEINVTLGIISVVLVLLGVVVSVDGLMAINAYHKKRRSFIPL